MTAPNMVNITSMIGKTEQLTLSTTAQIFCWNQTTNALLANSVFKVNTILVSNIDGTNAATFTIDRWNGYSSTAIFHQIDVPAKSTLVVLSKDTALYLEEGDRLNAIATAASDLTLTASYEIIQ